MAIREGAPGGVLAAAVGLGMLLGCASTCEEYPDRSTPRCAYETFLRALRTADLEVIEGAYTPARLEMFRAGEAKHGRDWLRDWYARDVEKFRFGDPEVDDVAGSLARVAVPVEDRRSGGGKGVLLFELVRTGAEWKIFRIRRSGFGQVRSDTASEESSWQNP